MKHFAVKSCKTTIRACNKKKRKHVKKHDFFGHNFAKIH